MHLPETDTLRPAEYAPTIALLDKAEVLRCLRERPVSPAPDLEIPAHYSVSRFGAVGDGETLDTGPIQQAVDAANSAGGGVVYFPPGVYICGGLELKSNVTLYLEAGSYIWAAESREQYVRPDGFGVFLTANGADNIAIRGRGTIYCSGHAFAKRPVDLYPTDMMNRTAVQQSSAAPEPAPEQDQWKPARSIFFERCTDVLIEGVTVRCTPMWAVHLRRCERVRINRVTVLNGVTPGVDNTGNGDGLDIDACSHVRISDCFVQASDDAICLKVMRRSALDGPAACRDIIVTGCTLTTLQTAIKIGTESRGEFRNILFSNCTVQEAAGGIGLYAIDGGLVDGVRFENIALSQSHGASIYMVGYRRNDDTPQDGVIRNVSFENITATSHAAFFMAGPESQVFRGISLRNVRFSVHGKLLREEAADPPVPCSLFPFLVTPYEIYVNNARDVSFADVSLNWDADPNPHWTSAMRCVNVDGLTVDGFPARQGGSTDKPAILLRNVRDAWVRHCAAAEGTGTFLAAEGDCRGILLSENDLSRAEKEVSAVSSADVRVR